MKEKQFNPETHCGFILSKSPERLQELVDSQVRKISRLEPGTSEYTAVKNRLEGYEGELRHYDPENPKRCVQPKGFRTSHIGQGHCKSHCACCLKPRRRGNSSLYSDLPPVTLQAAIDEVERSAIDKMDLISELNLLKALVLSYYRSKDPSHVTDMDDLRVVGELVDRISKMSERINTIKMKTAVTFEAVLLIIERMTNVLILHLQRWNGQVLDANTFMSDIKVDWSKIEVDPNTRQIGP